MSVEKLFTSLYRSVNGNNIRRAAVRYCQLPLDADKSCSQEVCRTDSGSEELETFYIAVSDDAPGRAVGEETVQLLEKLMANSQLPRLEYSLWALPLKEESAVQKFLDTGSAKKASGGVIISFCCARVAEQNEKFTLYRSSDITPFYHHALGTKAVELLSQISLHLQEMKQALDKLRAVETKVHEIENAKEKAFFYRQEVIKAMEDLRTPADRLEVLVDKKVWPFPTYGDLLFEV